MASNHRDSFGFKKTIYFQFTLIPVEPIKEFHGRRPAGSMDEAILAYSGSKLPLEPELTP